MKQFAKIPGVSLLVVTCCFVGLICLVKFLEQSSKREVIAIVARLTPGTPLSVAVEHLGQPTEIFKTSGDIIWWLEKAGTRVEPGLASNTVLHVFAHSGQPYRYVLVYTDRDTRKIVHADWCPM